MRIALAIPPAWSVMTAPLGIASIAGALVRAGHEVKVFDVNIRIWNRFRNQTPDIWDYSQYLLWQEPEKYQSYVLPMIQESLGALAAEVAAWNPEVLGLSLYDTSVNCGRTFASSVKARLPQLKVICGGPAVKIWALRESDPFDFAVIGEGEATTLELISSLQSHTPLEGCLGIGYRGENGKFVFTGTRPNINLTELPYPYFGDFDFRLYRERKLPVMMSRGCVAKCTFCSETRFWSKYRYREAHHIFAEFKNNYEHYGIAVYAMADSLINGNFKVLSELADLILASGMKIDWHGYARLDKRMTKELLQRLARSGLTWVSYGLETGSQKIMDLMEKRTTVATAREVIRETHKAGISVHLNMIVGFPGETEEDFLETLHFLEENMEWISLINTGETLAIGMDTPLGMTPEKFDVRLKTDGSIAWDEHGQWVSADGSNTYQVRRERLERLRSFVDRFPHVLQFPGGETRRQAVLKIPESSPYRKPPENPI